MLWVGVRCCGYVCKVLWGGVRRFGAVYYVVGGM